MPTSMGYADRVLASPYAWLLTLAVLLALVLATLLRLLLHRNAPRRARDRRLTLVFIFAAAAVALAAATLIVYEPSTLFAAEALVFLGVAAGVLTFALYFLRAVGIPLLFLLSAFGVFSIYLAEPWQPVAGERELLGVTVLAAGESAMSIEVRPLPGEPTGAEVLRLPGATLSAQVELVRYHPYWFVLGRRLGARAVALRGRPAETTAAGASDAGAGGDGDGVAPTEDVEFPAPCTDGLCRFVRARLPSIPGIDVERVETQTVPAAPLARYRLMVAEPGTVRLEPE